MLNSSPLRNWDEAWYAEIARNMASGNYGLLVPFWNGQYYFDKPPLYFWLSLPFFKIFGPGEWQARIISVLATAFATLLIYLIGKKLFNQKVGFLSSLVFVTLGQVWVRFSHGNLDALLVAIFLATFYTSLFAKQRKFAVLTGVFLGLGFLVKGWFLGLFPLAAIIAFSWVTKRRLPHNLLLVVLFAVLSSGWWYLLGTLNFGWSFARWYLLNPLGGGWTPSISLQPFWYLARDTGVWLIPVALQSIKVANGRILKAFALIVFLFVFSLGFFPEKFDWYNLPAYPFVALVVGYAMFRLVSARPWAMVLVPLLGTAQIFIAFKIENIYPDRSLVGTKLGLVAREIIKPGDTVILDDRDFTSFLYYSNHKEVFVVSREGGKPGEWWMLKYTDLPTFMSYPVVVISRDLNNFPPEFAKQPVLKKYLGYRFVRLSL